MHERYAHGAAIFLAAYAFRTDRWLTYILFSIACFLNLEWVMQWLGLSNYGTLLFDPRFVAALFALVIGLLFFRLYRGSFIPESRSYADGLRGRESRLYHPMSLT